MTHFGLYYPFIRVRDDAWLKTVALYWSRLGRLKPRHYRTTESPVAKALRDETDFFLDIDPEGQAAVDVGRQFIHLIDNYGGELEERYGIERPWIRHPGTAIADWESPTGDPLAYIHLAKLSEDLQYALSQAKLARPGLHHDIQWVGIHPRLASVYMCALTREIALHQRLQPLTDQDSEHLAIAGSSVEEVALVLLGSLEAKDRSARPALDLASRYVAMSFEAAIPQGIERVPVARIIRMRSDLSGELANFRDHVQSQSEQLKEIAAIDDRGMQSEHLRVLVKETAEGPLRDLEREMRVFGEVGHSLWNLQTLTPPGLAYAITSHAQSPLVTAGTAVAAGAFSATWTARRQRRRILRNSPVGYLLQIKRRARPAGTLRALAAASLLQGS